MLVALGIVCHASGLFDRAHARLHEDRLAIKGQEISRLRYLLLQRGLIQVKQDEPLPSTNVVPPEVIADGLPTVSIVTDEKGLYSPKEGIFTHIWERGREWERKATFSYFENGQLLCETPVGLRLHGGKSREGGAKSLRLVFRSSYSGFSRSQEGLFFNGESPPMRQIVLSNTEGLIRFLNPIALELAEQVGCITSRSQPARVYLNGERVPVGYFLLERQSPDYLRSYYGHSEFLWVRQKGQRSKKDRVWQYSAQKKWVKKAPAPITMEEAGKRFDLDQLSAWILAISFCGTNDEGQGAYYFDLRDPEARWRSTAWDMDGSFEHGTGAGVNDFYFDVIKGERGRLFRRLIVDDPAYRDFFRAKARHALDTCFSPDSIRRLIGKYRGYLNSDLFVRQREEIAPRLEGTQDYLIARSAIYMDALEAFIEEFAAKGASFAEE